MPLKVFALPLGVLLLDQAAKAVVVRALPEMAGRPVVPGLFNLVHVRNRGMAFGLLNEAHSSLPTLLLAAASLAVMGFLAVWLWRERAAARAPRIALGLILGGAAGNLIDRLRYREVVDFLDVYWRGWHWPAFNLADAAITVGGLLLVLTLLRETRRAP